MDTISSSFFVILFLGIHISSSESLRRQKRNWIIDSFQIEEENGGVPYELGKIELENKFAILRLKGQGVDKPPMGILTIDENTGVISVHGKVDFEQNHKLSLHFEAYERVQNILETRLSVEVTILDINDNAPTFTEPYYAVRLKESAPQGSYVIVVIAKDQDSARTINGTFDLRIISVTPPPSGFEFIIEQNGPYGNITFRGCLDYEKGNRYTILVEAKDHGDKVQLSSTCTVVVDIDDENNHLPVFTGSAPTGTVNERDVDVEVLRLQATDRDTKGTPGWRTKFIIHGPNADHFRIDTIPETNEGVLYVTKPLDYEDQSVLKLNISVENEEQYSSCEVVSKAVSGNVLWNVKRTGGKSRPLATRLVTVNVKDVNDPPIFNPMGKTVLVYEDVAKGHFLTNLTAVDRDVAHGNKITYVKGSDPANWVTVGRMTGAITTTKTLDRESNHVKDDIYEVTVFAVDDGEPAATGTGTLSIQLRDRNDNAPLLSAESLGICINDGDGPFRANLSAYDLDEVPFAGPFRFKLHGDVENKWKVHPQNGYSVNLIRGDMVFSGYHQVVLEVFDQQDHSSLHNLTVHVCQCETTGVGGDVPCLGRLSSNGTNAWTAILIMLIALILLLGILLLSLLLSCKKEVMSFPDEGRDQILISSNTEHPGSDCKMALKTLHQENEHIIKSNVQQTSQQPNDLENDVFATRLNASFRGTRNGYTSAHSSFRGPTGLSKRNSSMRRSHNGFLGSSAYRGTQNGFTATNSEQFAAQEDAEYSRHRQILQQLLNERYQEELGDYAPHLYAEEGSPEGGHMLDTISMQEVPFDVDLFHDQDDKFNALASVCTPVDTSS